MPPSTSLGLSRTTATSCSSFRPASRLPRSSRMPRPWTTWTGSMFPRNSRYRRGRRHRQPGSADGPIACFFLFGNLGLVENNRRWVHMVWFVDLLERQMIFWSWPGRSGFWSYDCMSCQSDPTPGTGTVRVLFLVCSFFFLPEERSRGNTYQSIFRRESLACLCVSFGWRMRLLFRSHFRFLLLHVIPLGGQIHLRFIPLSDWRLGIDAFG